MHAAAPLPRLKRVPFGVWPVVAWCAGTAFTFLTRMELPGQDGPAVRAGVFYLRWDGLTLLALATGLVVAGSLLMRERALTALGLLLAAAALGTLPLSVGEIPLPQFLMVDVTLYFIAATRPRRTGVIALTLSLTVLAGYLTTRLAFGWSVGTSEELAVALTAVIAWLIGNSAYQARVHAERTHAEAAARAVSDERLRIARETHDMVAHTIGVVALQAGAAVRVIDTRPDAAREAMVAVETAARETLSGLRRMLGALRRHEDTGRDGDRAGQGDAGGSLRPVAGLADVETLAAATTAAGVRVDVEWRGESRPLPPDIDLSAFRIIQESVTNVVRHVGAGSCRVTVDRRRDELIIEVVDDGPGDTRTGTEARALSGSASGAGGGASAGARTGGGYGLAGMRERVALLHGEFSAAPRAEGGFRVTARLPLPTGVR
ncbi:histidine kinase [Streptomyces sp. NPDC006551]|uniref:sensor histidine kinase n=1 Tax=Streptomyces sp. NPDC006551 TaxID=3157178 RepID=UPI0033BD45B6